MTLDMTYLAYGALILAALAFGVIVQMYFQPKTSYEWLITAVGASLGAWFVSELTWTTTQGNVGPTWEGLTVIPAVLGGLVVGAIFELVARSVEPASTPA